MPRKKQVENLTPVDQDKGWFSVVLGQNYFKSYGVGWNVDIIKGLDTLDGAGPRVKLKFKCADGKYAELVMHKAFAAALALKVAECVEECDRYDSIKGEEIAWVGSNTK
jgi:hypothetical protein